VYVCVCECLCVCVCEAESGSVCGRTRACFVCVICFELRMFGVRSCGTVFAFPPAHLPNFTLAQVLEGVVESSVYDQMAQLHSADIYLVTQAHTRCDCGFANFLNVKCVWRKRRTN
jgi:hypothetical protein